MQNNITKNVFVTICDRVTPNQEKAIKMKNTVNIGLFKDIRKWFIDNSNCESFREQPCLDDIEELQPHVFNEAKEHQDEPVDPQLENTFGGISYSFSLARDPNEETSVFRTSKKFACAMVRETNPVLLLHGGDYAAEMHFHMVWGDPTKKEELQYRKQKSSDDTYDSPCRNS